MNDFLAKPVTPEELERCLRHWLPTLPSAESAAAEATELSDPACFIAWPALHTQLLSLRALLQSQDTAALDALDRLTPSLIHAFGNEGYVLNTQVQNFSFDTALSTLKPMLRLAQQRLADLRADEAG